jgi:integrase
LKSSTFASRSASRDIVLNEEGVALFKRLDLPLKKANGQRWAKSDQARPMAEACKAAGLEPIGFHGLRHTWASLAIRNGVPLLIVARNLGHSTTRMVEKHYGHLAASYVSDAIRAGGPKFKW